MPRINYEAIKYEDHCGCDYQDLTVNAIYAGFDDDYVPTWKRFPLAEKVDRRPLQKTSIDILNKMSKLSGWKVKEEALDELYLRAVSA